MSLLLRYMRRRDIKPVVAIDRLCFQPPWSADSYTFEIKQSSVSHMAVLERRAPSAPVMAAGWRGRLRQQLLRPRAGAVLGYGGIWQIDGEAHISTLAVHPAWRGCGYGEIVLAGLFGKALRLRADYIVLEVRVGNAAAQALYGKYGFRRVARKRQYYQNNKEDAWDMRVTLDGAARARYARLLAGLRRRQAFDDGYSRASRPRG